MVGGGYSAAVGSVVSVASVVVSSVVGSVVVAGSSVAGASASCFFALCFMSYLWFVPRVGSVSVYCAYW